MTPRIVTAEEFASISPYAKGYYVYMLGAHEDQVNVPEHYDESMGDFDEFKRGEWQAYLNILDGEE